MELKPMGDKVVVRQSEKESVSAGGIALVHRKEEMPDQGSVVAVGPKAESVAVGDNVIFRMGAGVPIRFDGYELLALSEVDVYAAVTP